MSQPTRVGGFTRADLEPDLADRMRRSLRLAGVSVQDMADYLEVARNTVSTWINGRITPSGQTLRLWAMRTGVPYEWLRTGELPVDDDPPTPDPLYAPWDSNPEPSDSQPPLCVLPLRRPSSRTEQVAA